MRHTAALLLAALATAGCSQLEKLPEGAQLQSSTFGVRVAPQAVDGAPLVLGSHQTIVTTAQPGDAGPNLNRFEGSAPGIHLKSTVATGDVGEQIDAAGGPEALRHLVDGPPGRSLPAAAELNAEARSAAPGDADESGGRQAQSGPAARYQRTPQPEPDE